MFEAKLGSQILVVCFLVVDSDSSAPAPAPAPAVTGSVASSQPEEPVGPNRDFPSKFSRSFLHWP